MTNFSLALFLSDLNLVGLLSYDLCVGGCDSWQTASKSGVMVTTDDFCWKAKLTLFLAAQVLAKNLGEC